MLFRLLTILFSSWITTPLVLIFAQTHGFANIDAIQLILITQAAQTPLLVLFNECTTPNYIKQNLRTPHALVFGATTLQFAIIYSSLLLSGRSLNDELTLFAALLATTSSFITLTEAQRVTYAALIGKLSFRESLGLGTVPSVALLALYLFHYYYFDGTNQEWLLLHLVLPALVYRRISSRLPTPPSIGDRPSMDLVAKSMFAGICLLALTAINVQIRAELGETVPQYNSIILAGLNITSSLFLTVSRVNHIKRPHDLGEKFTFKSVIPTLLLSILISLAPSIDTAFLSLAKFLALQALLIFALIRFRSIWTPPPNSRNGS